MSTTKAKVNLPLRNKSNPPFKNLPPSQLLEEQTKKMERQLQELKEVMAQRAVERENLNSGDGTMWKSAAKNLPIKNYAKQVLENKSKIPLITQGSKGNMQGVISVQAKEKVAREKLVSREKLPPISNSTSTTPNGASLKNKENDPFKDTLNSELNISNRVPTPVNKIPSNQEIPTETINQNKLPTTQNIPVQNFENQTGANQVDEFLKEIGLPQYIPVFKEHGFDDFETMLEIQTKHLVEMKIPAGHQIKLSKRLEQLRQTTPVNKPTTPVQKPVSVISNAVERKANNVNSSIPKKSDYIQLEEPTKELAVGNDTSGGEFLQGTFNEAESHQSFLEALNEWRSTKPIEGEKPKSRPKDSRSKKVRFAEPEKDNEEESKKKNLNKKEDSKPFIFAGGETFTPSDKHTSKDTGTDTDPKSLRPKVSCWNCYQLVAENDAIQLGKKHVCSERCADAYRSLNSVTCMKKNCGKKFLKEEGIMDEGRWYCDEKCSPTQEELLMEEQRLMNHLAKEMGYQVNTNEEVQNEDEQQEEDEEEENDNDNEEEKGKVEMEGGFDLTVSVSNKKEVLSLAELEEKYKNLNQVTEKAEEEKEKEREEDEFEDSLN